MGQVETQSGGGPFDVLVRFADGEKLLIGDEDFVTHLQQRIALGRPGRGLVGAEIWIRAGR